MFFSVLSLFRCLVSACSKHKGGQKRIQNFNRKKLKESDHMEYLSVDGNLILKYDIRLCIAFI